MVGVNKVNNKSGIVTLQMTDLIDNLFRSQKLKYQEYLRQNEVNYQTQFVRRLTPNPNSKGRHEVPESAQIQGKYFKGVDNSKELNYNDVTLMEAAVGSENNIFEENNDEDVKNR